MRSRLAALITIAAFTSASLIAVAQPKSGKKPPAKPPPPAASSAPEPPPPPPPPSPSPEDVKKEEAKPHFDKGVKLLEEGAWDAALAEFLRSREIFPTRGATQNAALALRKLQRFDEALDMFQALLREFTNVSPKDRSLVEKEIAELRALVGSLDVRASESGASVVVDGRDRGVTPIAAPLKVPAGSHMLRVYKEGFAPFETRVEIAGGQSASIVAKLGALTQAGRLKVTEQTGAKADVLVDNVVVGKTPWEGPLPVGDHTVVLRGEGNLGTQPAPAPIKLSQITPLTLALEPLEAGLRVEPTPVGARVAINGVAVGRGIWEGRVRAGGHRVEIAEDGFLPVQRELSLGAGKREVMAVSLERDPSSPVWRAANPPRIVFDVTTGFAFAPVFGGQLGDGCTGACERTIGIGGVAMLHGGYQLPSGITFMLDVGYALVSQKFHGRPTDLRPVGKGANHGTADDELLLTGPTLGASAALHRGERWPLLVRLGGGVLLGSMYDQRSGTFSSDPKNPAASYSVPVLGPSSDARYAYIAPELRLGYRLGKHAEISLGVQGLILLAVTQPKWPKETLVAAGNQGLAQFDDEEQSGKVALLIAPGLGLRVDF